MKHICLLLLFPLVLYSQVGISSYAPATGKATAVAGDINSLACFDFNPASATKTENIKISVNYSQPFLIKELGQASIFTLFPIKNAFTIGGAIRTFKFSEFREIDASILYSQDISNNITFAIQPHYYSINIQNFASYKTFYIDVGTIINAKNGFFIGAFAKNVNNAKIENNITRTLPTTLSIGVAYMPSEKAILNLDIEKNIYYTPNVKVGAKYSPNNVISIVLGGQSNPASATAGITLNINNKAYISISFGYFSNIIGISPFTNIEFVNNSKNKRTENK